ncbi:MAG: cadherin-like beta sandwich domain-containing protein [Lachnospiraceae bacterium]|nr:cadherin-like beta sandwich domain-containing protein [Lachnospiraceae bacterium]
MKRGLFLILLAATVLLGARETAQAAVATIELQTEAEEIRVDDEFEVTLTITAQPLEGETAGDATIGDFEAHLMYDADIMEFVTAPSCITGGAGMLRISDIGASASAGTRKYVMRFRALERGESILTMYTMPMVYVYGSGDAMSVSNNELNLTVLPSRDASDNANLSALRVNPGKLSPAFATTIREYEVSVPNETTMIVVSALTEDGNATVGVSGSTNLQIGRNTVVVTVTAEDGTERRYYLYVTREEETVEPTEAPKEPDPEGFEAGVHAEERNGTVVLTYGGEYTVSAEADNYVAPTGYEETVLYLDGIKVKAYAKRDVPDSDFFVLILQNELGVSGYYRYDREEQTLQRYDEESIEIRQVVEEDNSALYETIDKYKSQQVLLLFLLAMFIALSVLLLLVMLHLYRRDRTDDNELGE